MNFKNNPGLREGISENVVHFQNPNCAQYTKESLNKQKLTVNKRNMSTYNFLNSDEKCRDQSFGKRVYSRKQSPNIVTGRGVPEQSPTHLSQKNHMFED